MDEDMKKRIRESAEGLELPKSLCPEQIETLLAEKTRKKPVPIFRFAAVAAAALAVLLVVPAIYPGTQPKGQGEETISLLGAPVDEGTLKGPGLSTYSADTQLDLKTAANMEDLQARIQVQNAGAQGEKRAAGLMAADISMFNGLEAEVHEDYGSAGPIGLSGDILWFYKEGTGLTAVSTEEGRLIQSGQIPDGDEGSVTAFYAAEGSLFAARQQGETLLTQIYSQQADGQWEETWRAVSEGKFESVESDGTYFYVTLRCYPKAGEEERAFLPVAGGRQLQYEEIYLPDGAVEKNQYIAAFAVDSKSPSQTAAAAAVFGGGDMAELVFDGGRVWAQQAPEQSGSSAKTGGFTAEGTQLDGQPALQVTMEEPGAAADEKQPAALTIPEFVPGPGQIVTYGNAYAVVPAVSAEGKTVRLVVSYDETLGLALERVMETEGEVRAVLCSRQYLYLLTDETLLCYNRTACGLAGSLDIGT